MRTFRSGLVHGMSTGNATLRDVFFQSRMTIWKRYCPHFSCYRLQVEEKGARMRVKNSWLMEFYHPNQKIVSESPFFRGSVAS